MAAARPTFTMLGIAFVANGGTITSHALARASASRKPMSKPSSACRVTSASDGRSATEQVGQGGEEILGVGDHLVEHPAAADEDHERDAAELGHEGERVLLHLRDRLDERDEHAD